MKEPYKLTLRQYKAKEKKTAFNVYGESSETSAFTPKIVDIVQFSVQDSVDIDVVNN